MCVFHINVIFRHQHLTFNNNKTQSAPLNKHLRLALDSKLDFNQHINDEINRCHKIIGIMKRLSLALS